MQGNSSEKNANPSGITERFEIAEVLPSGKTSLAYKAADTVMGDSVTVKTIAPDHVNKDNLHRFQSDLKTISSIDHDCIAKLIDYGHTRSGKPYMVLEHIDGTTLKEYLKNNGPMPVQQALFIIEMLCDALATCHEEGVVHRDIKPNNIFLVPITEEKEDKLLPVIIDFGFGSIRLPNERGIVRTSQGVFAGEPCYMSPEQIKGEEEDYRTDIYSLGCLFYEILTGSPPYKSKDPNEVFALHIESTPPPLPDFDKKNQRFHSIVEERIQAMLEKNRDLRLSDLDEFAQLLSTMTSKKKSKKASEAKAGFSIVKFAATTVSIALVLLATTTIFTQINSENRQITDKPVGSSKLATVIERMKFNSSSELNAKTINLVDGDVPEIVKVKNLKKIVFSGHSITINGLTELLRHPQLESVVIFNPEHITEKNCSELNAKFGRDLVELKFTK